MAIHYSVESLPSLFSSEAYCSDKDSYKQSHRLDIQSLQSFLDSIEINKQYFRTGIQVKNPRYKKRVSDDTSVIKQLKSSLNKMSSINHKALCDDIKKNIQGKSHLYPLLLQSIFEQACFHHTYCSYYAVLVKDLHELFKNKRLIEQHMELCYQRITREGTNPSDKMTSDESSAYSKLCHKNKQTDQFIGYSILVCELELLHVIRDQIEPLIQELVSKLSTLTSEDELYKCVICLYSIFNRVYSSEPLPEHYTSALTEIKQTMKFMKIKFKLMDILERR